MILITMEMMKEMAEVKINLNNKSTKKGRQLRQTKTSTTKIIKTNTKKHKQLLYQKHKQRNNINKNKMIAHIRYSDIEKLIR